MEDEIFWSIFYASVILNVYRGFGLQLSLDLMCMNKL